MKSLFKKTDSVQWQGNGRFSVGGVSFIARNIDGAETGSSLDGFFVMKSGKMIRHYEKIVETLRPKHILELGIFQGGSAVFFHALSSAKKHVAIELGEKRIEVIDQYIKMHGLEDSLKLFYGVNQADREAVTAIVKKELEGKIDLVIDDASHFLNETRVSFDTIFPYVVPGGAYIIEDWAWAHARIDGDKQSKGLYPDKEPLTKLIFEIIMACPSTEAFIERIEVDRFKVVVWRGDKEIPKENFAIENCFSEYSRGLIA